MILVYEGVSGFSHYQLFTCAESATTPVDHLHFTLRVRVGSIYREEFDGTINTVGCKSIQDILNKLSELYVDGCAQVKQQGVADGTISIQ